MCSLPQISPYPALSPPTWLCVLDQTLSDVVNKHSGVAGTSLVLGWRAAQAAGWGGIYLTPSMGEAEAGGLWLQGSYIVGSRPA